MVNGKQIAPHLPFLRRFLRALLGNQVSADGALRKTLERIQLDHDIPSNEQRLRIALHKIAYDVASSEEQDSNLEASTTDHIVVRRLGRLSLEERAALLLTSMEGFSVEEMAVIIGRTIQAARALSDDATSLVQSQLHARILIIEDEPVIAMDLESTVTQLGHTVVGVATTRDSAVEMAKERQPQLVIADIQLADDSSGIDAVKDILAERSVPTIFITAYPERLLTGTRPEPTFLITKPFQRSTVRSAVTQALFFSEVIDPISREEDETTLLNEQSIKSKPGPIDAQVRAGQLQIVDRSTVDTKTSLDSIEAARKLHLRTAKRLMDSIAGSNAAPRVYHRLDAIRRVLSRKLTAERSLQLGIQAKGFEGMLSGVAEILEESTLADLSVFASDLVDLARQFPNYREFVDEAQRFESLTNEARQALVSVTTIFADQVDELVEPRLKMAIVDTRDAATQKTDHVTDLALVRTAGNLVRAIARLVNKHASAILKQAGKTFDSLGGRLIGMGLVTLIIGTPMVKLLGLLQFLLPNEFGFIGSLVRLAKALLGL